MLYDCETGVNNSLRRKSMTYTDTTTKAELQYTGEAASKLGRPSGIRFDGSDETSYRHLGLDQIIGDRYVGTTPDIEMTFEAILA
mgnify:CR=1 FL=1